MSANWKQVTLGEICAFKYGEMPNKNDLADEGYPVFSGYRVVGSSSRYHYRNPEIVVVARGVGGTGDIKMSPSFCFLTNLSIAILIQSPAVDKKFLYYQLASTTLWGLRTGSAQAQITIERLKEYKVRIPPLPLQRRIAGILSTYDDLIENNQRRIKILEEMARALYREWFVNFRFPGHEKVPLVDSSLGPIPKGWEVVAIDDVCERVTDGSHFSPKSVDDGMPMASSKDMHDWGLNLETCRYIGREDFEQLVRNGCRPQKNDVLVTKDGANYLQHIFVVRKEQQLVLLSSIAILRPNARINPHLLTAILKAPENKGRLKNYVTGAAIPRIILQDFKRFQILLPIQGVQRAWAKIAEPITQLCWTLIDQNANLRRTRDLLLPRLLSGGLALASPDNGSEAA